MSRPVLKARTSGGLPWDKPARAGSGHRRSWPKRLETGTDPLWRFAKAGPVPIPSRLAIRQGRSVRTR